MTESFDLEALVGEFRDEARDQIDRVDAGLLQLERDGSLDDESRSDLLRTLHTLKGNAGMLGLSAIRDAVHGMENVLKPAEEGVPEAVLERLFQAAAGLRSAVEAAGGDRQEPVFRDLASLRHRLEEAHASAPEPGAAPARDRVGASSPSEWSAPSRSSRRDMADSRSRSAWPAMTSALSLRSIRRGSVGRQRTCTGFCVLEGTCSSATRSRFPGSPHSWYRSAGRAPCSIDDGSDVSDERTRNLLVDDSPFIRRAVERMLEPVPGVVVVATATNGTEAIERTRELRPDLVILDIVMPEVDGLEAIREIMASTPTPILVLSSHAQPGAEVTLKALELGAVDSVSKSRAGTRMDIYDLAPLLREKVQAAARSRVPREVEPDEPGPPSAADSAATPGGAPTGAIQLLALGASTGGPRALGAILSTLPGDFPAGLVIAQHMPAGFTGTLARRLDRRSALRVREAEDGDRIEAGVALIGPGGHQMKVERDSRGLHVAIPEDTDRLLHHPSVELLFTSVATAVGSRAAAAVLTGMEEDGAEGLRSVREAGGRTFAESEENAVIYGMPRVAAEWADEILPLDALARRLRELGAGRD